MLDYGLFHALLFTHDPVRWKETSLDLAGLSLLALVLTVLVSCTTTVNAGFVAIALAWVIGVYLAPLSGQSIGLKGVVTGFPSVSPEL
jgi:hypothetical protein